MNVLHLGVQLLEETDKETDEMIKEKNMGSASKFKILTEWTDNMGRLFSKSQMGSR